MSTDFDSMVIGQAIYDIKYGNYLANMYKKIDRISRKRIPFTDKIAKINTTLITTFNSLFITALDENNMSKYGIGSPTLRPAILRALVRSAILTVRHAILTSNSSAVKFKTFPKISLTEHKKLIMEFQATHLNL